MTAMEQHWVKSYCKCIRITTEQKRMFYSAILLVLFVSLSLASQSNEFSGNREKNVVVCDEYRICRVTAVFKLAQNHTEVIWI